MGQGNLGLYPCFPYFFLHADILVKIGGIRSIFDTQNDKIIRENYFVYLTKLFSVIISKKHYFLDFVFSFKTIKNLKEYISILNIVQIQ